MIVFIGIDVACRKGGQLPICVATREGDRLRPIEVSADQRMRLPRGPGNREIPAAEPFKSPAIQVARALKEIAVMQHWRIDRIAIDAPAAPPKAGGRPWVDCLMRTRSIRSRSSIASYPVARASRSPKATGGS